MKKSLLLLAVMAIMAVIPASAQVQFGIKGGMSNTSLSFGKDVFSTKSGVGWFVGPSVKVGFPLVGVDIAAMYDQRNSKINDETITQKSIVIPVNARLNFDLSKAIGIYVAAGPQFGFNVGDKKFEWGDENGNIHNTFQLKNSSFSINLGAGIFLEKFLEVGFAYNIAMGKTGDASWSNAWNAVTSKETYKDDTKNKTWTLSVGIYF